MVTTSPSAASVVAIAMCTFVDDLGGDRAAQEPVRVVGRVLRSADEHATDAAEERLVAFARDDEPAVSTLTDCGARPKHVRCDRGEAACESDPVEDEREVERHGGVLVAHGERDQPIPPERSLDLAVRVDRSARVAFVDAVVVRVEEADAVVVRVIAIQGTLEHCRRIGVSVVEPAPDLEARRIGPGVDNPELGDDGG